MRTRHLVFGIAASVALVAACGSSDDEGSDTTAAPATSPAASAAGGVATTASGGTAATDSAPVVAADSSLGRILTTADGFTVYGFKNDSDGTSTCTGACAENWPAVTTPSEELPAGLDPQVFSVVEGADEIYQLKAGDWPLYTFAGDAAAGDTNGQGQGGVWFVVAPDGKLIEG